MVNLFLAAAIATAPATEVAQAPLPDANPAIFVIQDADTTVYLFGTFHALDGKTDWFNGQVRTAFDESAELILETMIPDAPPPVAAPPFRRFTSHELKATPSASFLGTTRMAVDAGRANGMSVGKGADMVLRRAAELAGKRVEGLETLESQFNMFSRLSIGAGKAAAAPAPAVLDQRAKVQLSKAMTEMQSAWNQGDQAIFVRMLDKLRRNSPATYRMLFTERNGRWADWIAARMDTPGSVFVAVGAGHFAGSDSVLVRLAQMGFESHRLN